MSADSTGRTWIAGGDYVVISPPPNRASGVDHRGPAVEAHFSITSCTSKVGIIGI